jgi:transposase, IS30 family
MVVQVLREDRQRLWAEVRAGRWVGEAAAAVGVSPQRASRVFADSGGMMEPAVRPSGRYLSHAEREEIAVLHAQKVGVREIARRLGRCHTSIGRELGRNSNRDGCYRALRAQRRAEQRARRPKPGKLARQPRLRALVEAKLEDEQWSPQQISSWLQGEFGNDGSMTCSHETIYRSLFVQSRGELRRELSRHLRTGRDQRKPHHRPERRKGRLVEPISIRERPAEAEDRAVAGHWEGDLILGKAGGSAIGTLVERSTRFVMLVHLPARRTAPDFRDALVPVIGSLPEQLRRSLTWDQGKEMALHRDISIAAQIPIYFADPRSPWQRGSNENTNGLLRQYFPRNVSLRQFTPADLDEVAAKLNRRPRKTLDWDTPAQRLTRLLSTPPDNTGATTT